MIDQPQAEQHQMRLQKTHASGTEEWYCPTCGRRFLLHWPPNYEKIVLEAGDEYAIHSGGKGGLQIGQPWINENDGSDLSAELRAALEEALEDLDFDDWPEALD